MKICKKFTFEASHQLNHHDGKCANLHGHSYQLEVCVSGEIITEGAKQGMVMDFADLKKIVKEEIIGKCDHAILLAREDALKDVITSKKVIFPFQTTAENMSSWMSAVLQKRLPASVQVEYVRLWETATGFAQADKLDGQKFLSCEVEYVD